MTLSNSFILLRLSPAKCGLLFTSGESIGNFRLLHALHHMCVSSFFLTCFADLLSGRHFITISVLPPYPNHLNFSLAFSSGSRKHPLLRTSWCFWLVRKKLKQWPKPVETLPSISLMAAHRWWWCLFMLLCPTFNNNASFRLLPRWGNAMGKQDEFVCLHECLEEAWNLRG